MNLQEFYQSEKIKYLPVKTWNVKSNHCHPDTGEFNYYLVEMWADGEWTCSCPAGFYGKKRKKCRHIIQKIEELAEEKFNK